MGELYMKTLIINGSPRKKGDTASLLTEMKKYLSGEITELSAYYDDIKPCIDCRYCSKKAKCVIQDKMNIIYEDDFDNVVIASPIYMSNLTPPLMAIASRLQVYYAAKRFLNKKIELRSKEGALILVGGGDGSPDPAIKLASWMFKKMNASFNPENMVCSLKTDDVPASQDIEALESVKVIGKRLSKRK